MYMRNFTSRFAITALLASAAIVALSACRSPEAKPPRAPLVAVDDSPPDGRLDDRATPTRYQLTFDLDPAAPNLRGTARIELTLNRATKTIWLNGRKLKVSAVSLQSLAPADIVAALQNKRAIAPAFTTAPVATQASDELLRIDLPAVVPPGPYRLDINYEAEWGNKVGLVRVTPDADEPDGLSLFVTDFEPSDARAAFPCFDDPRFKTPFDITAIAPNAWATLSNSPEVRRVELAPRAGLEAAGPRANIRFASTPPLPTYLVALASGDYEATAASSDATPIRIWAPRGSLARVAYLAPKASQLAAWMSDYLAQPMRLPKLDFWVIPPLAAATGGMENPGLVTLSAAAILPPFASERSGTHAIAHEIAHMWFGNSLTMHWWDDLWLSEGFATWLSNRALLATQPNWSLFYDGNFHPSKVQPKGGFHAPVQRAVEPYSPADAQKMFNPATYALGAATLASWETVIGADAFRIAMQRWVHDHRRSTVTTDMWIDDFAPSVKTMPTEDVKNAIRTQLTTTAVPTINVAVNCSGAPQLDVTLAPLPLPKDGIPSPITPRAPSPLPETPPPARAAPAVPLCVQVADVAQPVCAIIDENMHIPLQKCPAWIAPDPRGGRDGIAWTMAPGELSRAATSHGLNADNALGFWLRSLNGKDRFALDETTDRAAMFDILDFATLLASSGAPQGYAAFEKHAVALFSASDRSILFARVRSIAGTALDAPADLAKLDRVRRAMMFFLAAGGDPTMRKALAAPTYSLAKLPTEADELRRVAFALDNAPADRAALLAQPLTWANATVLAHLLDPVPAQWLQKRSAAELKLYVGGVLLSPAAEVATNQVLNAAAVAIDANQLRQLITRSCSATQPAKVLQRIAANKDPNAREGLNQAVKAAARCAEQRKRWRGELIAVGAGPLPR
jgi:alanyl aminopeptidase